MGHYTEEREEEFSKAMRELRQVGGNHYDLPIQPNEYIQKNGLGFFEGNVVKYVTRHKKKDGVKDLKKALHYLQLLIAENGG